MHKLIDLYEAYLSAAGRLEQMQLGPAADRNMPVSHEQRQQFVSSLKAADRFNKRMVVVVMSLFCMLFLLGVALVFRFIESPEKMGLVFGGTFLSLVSVITGLQKLWREKSAFDVLLTVLPNLSPAESVKVVEVLYYSQKK